MSSLKKKKLMKETTRSLHDSLTFLDKTSSVPKELEEKYLEFVLDLVETDRSITSKYTTSKEWVDRILKLRKKHKIHPRKAQLRALYEKCLDDGTIIDNHVNLEQYLTIKQSRSLSGVLVIAVLMSPYPVYLDSKTGKVKQQRFSCAHNCYYCPNEPGMPRSYLSKEAAVARALRADFDAIDQFYSRANTLKKLGHDVDKIELLVLGGTFCQFPVEYQEQFIRDLFWSANTFYDGISDFCLKRARKSLSEEIKIHETATKCRIIGLTLETRPDTIRDFETIKRFREYGATRLQIGVQHTDDTILKYINRGCYNADTILAVRLLKNSGYKIDMHLMPNLPGSNMEKDEKMFVSLLSDDLIQCDQWKVYPCQTVDYSLIQKWFKSGSYKPYSLDKLMNVVIKLKSTISPWIRLNRIFRSLPTEHITSGITMSNFRQHLYAKMNEKGLKCKCIRCREVGTHIRRKELNREYSKVLQDKLSKIPILKKRQYKSSGGDEIFISLESQDESILHGFVRLRLSPIYIRQCDRSKLGLLPNEAFLNGYKLDKSGIYGNELEYKQLIETFPELYQAALVREAHVYGAKQNVKNKDFGGSSSLTTTGSANDNLNETQKVIKEQNLSGQSRGFGTKLMSEAESIARNAGYSRIAVIAGVGTRLFYRLKLGYKSGGSYMIKDFNESNIGSLARGNVNKINLSFLKSTVTSSIIACFGLYILSSFLSIILSLFLAILIIGYLDYLHFIKIKHKNSVNPALLRLSKIGLILINFAILFKCLSAFFPHIPGLRIPAILSLLFGGKDGSLNNDWGQSNNCFCRTYWVLSLSSYVTAFYILKLMYHKRVVIMIQNPMFGNDSGIKSLSISIAGLLFGQIVLFSFCQYLVSNYVTSHCVDEGLTNYDLNKAPFGCHDTFESVDVWAAILAIVFDAALFSLFCSRWYGLILIFMEEMATSLLVQFSLVIIAMLSCITDAMLHLLLLYSNLDKTNTNNYHSDSFDSMLGTPAFLLDCLIIATCLVLSFTDSQKYIMNKLGIKHLTPYYQSLENLGYTLHIM